MNAAHSKRFRVALSSAVSMTAMIATGGCSTMHPGSVATVQPVTQSPRVGNVFLFRGIVGVFSTGLNQLGREINSAGVHADVFQDDQWVQLADMLVARYSHRDDAEPLVLVGHSWGADHIIAIATRLNAAHIPVTMILTLDPVTPPPLPPNVQRCENLYQSNGIFDAFPLFRGVPLKAADGSTTELANYDLHSEQVQKAHPELYGPDVNHFSIEKSPKVHAEVIKQILAVCPKRLEWNAMRRAGQQQYVTTPTTQPQLVLTN